MIVRGPYTIKWGENTITDVTELAFNYDVATNDYETVQGNTYTIDGAITVSVDLTLLSSDVATLSALFPQYYVAPGGTLSTGEKVSEESGSEGAIDIVAAQCGETDILYPLDITSCNGQVLRLVNAKTSLSAIDVDGAAARTVQVTFRGMPVEGAETAVGQVQMFKEGTISEES